MLDFLEAKSILKRTAKQTLRWAGAFLFAFYWISGSAVPAQEGHVLPWGYEGGTRPEHWGEMEKDHEKHMMCRDGFNQSPVDIRDVPGVMLASLGSHYNHSPLHLINNGHTIHVGYDPGSFADWGNEKFQLIQYHFHHPSEHRVMGKAFDMEMHLVHKTPDHQYVVIGIFMKKGKHNPSIQKIWDRISKEINKEVTYEDVRINAGEFLPNSKKYYHYTGSLTTPPCSENVSWFVMETPIEISDEQIRYFQKYIDHNARPTQKLHHRILIRIP